MVHFLKNTVSCPCWLSLETGFRLTANNTGTSASLFAIVRLQKQQWMWHQRNVAREQHTQQAGRDQGNMLTKERRFAQGPELDMGQWRETHLEWSKFIMRATCCVFVRLVRCLVLTLQIRVNHDWMCVFVFVFFLLPIELFRLKKIILSCANLLIQSWITINCNSLQLEPLFWDRARMLCGICSESMSATCKLKNMGPRAEPWTTQITFTENFSKCQVCVGHVPVK